MAKRPVIMVVDDEPDALAAMLDALARRFGGDYRVIPQLSAHAALDAITKIKEENEEEQIALVIADQRMPEISGTEFLTRVKALYPDTIRIVLSGYTDFATVTNVINEGAIYKFLTKPWNDEALRSDIRQAFRLYSEHRLPVSTP